jgi:ABC-type transport system involved in multi-copper enzyme maturation permease subunit
VGVQASDVAVLIGAAAIFLILAVIAYHRRDITIGAWPT